MEAIQLHTEDIQLWFWLLSHRYCPSGCLASPSSRHNPADQRDITLAVHPPSGRRAIRWRWAHARCIVELKSMVLKGRLLPSCRYPGRCRRLPYYVSNRPTPPTRLRHFTLLSQNTGYLRGDRSSSSFDLFVLAMQWNGWQVQCLYLFINCVCIVPSNRWH